MMTNFSQRGANDMAFMGLMIVGIILFILGLLGIFSLLFLVIGFFIRKKHKKISNVLFTLSGINITILAVILFMIFLPKPKTVETPNGKARLYPSWISQYEKYLDTNDTEGMGKLIEKHPEMIYYYDSNRVTLLDYGMYNLNIELMKIAIDHGAVFDDPLTYDHLIFDNSFHSFFQELDYPAWKKEVTHEKGVTTDEMIETVTYMIEHGASLEYENSTDYGYHNFYEQAADWVMEDGTMSRKDRQLLQLIENNLK